MSVGDRMSRRVFTTLGATAAAGALLASETAAQRPESAPALKAEWLMDLIVRTDANGRAIGPRYVVGISSGSFAGPRLQGRIVGPGGEWGVRTPDGAYHIDVRFQLQTDDDAMIYLAYGGVIHPFQAGNQPQQQYWVNTPKFETVAPKYDWLNRVVCVGVHYSVPRELGSLAYHVYAISG